VTPKKKFGRLLGLRNACRVVVARFWGKFFDVGVFVQEIVLFGIICRFGLLGSTEKWVLPEFL